MAAARHIPSENAAFRAGRWQESIGVGLAGKTLGLLGLGRIGSRMAAIGHAFDMKTIAWSENLTPERAAEHKTEHVSKEQLFARADFVCVHLILSKRTRGLVGAAELALMQPGAWLINTSRGPIVDEAALIATLQAKRIAGAAVDVYDTEPLPKDHPLRTLPNLLATPHIGYVTEPMYRVFYGDTVKNVVAWLDGKEFPQATLARG
jgi:phosphoglycerate dehydrogenase-like enzyme